jgi:hypothetical protein
MLIVPFKPSIPEQEFSLQIGPSQYWFRALWNARHGASGFWFCDVLEIDRKPIAKSVAIALGTFLGRTSTHPLFRAGAFVAVDTSKQSSDAGLDDLGTRVQVRYYDLPDLMARFARAGFIG